MRQTASWHCGQKPIRAGNATDLDEQVADYIRQVEEVLEVRGVNRLEWQGGAGQGAPPPRSQAYLCPGGPGEACAVECAAPR